MELFCGGCTNQIIKSTKSGRIIFLILLESTCVPHIEPDFSLIITTSRFYISQRSQAGLLALPSPKKHIRVAFDFADSHALCYSLNAFSFNVLSRHRYNLWLRSFELSVFGPCEASPLKSRVDCLLRHAFPGIVFLLRFLPLRSDALPAAFESNILLTDAIMSSSVRFRFKSARQFETLSFEGDFVKVADLKIAIVQRKKLNCGEGFDLEISDDSSGEGMLDIANVDFACYGQR